MGTTSYFHLPPGQLPSDSAVGPFRAVVVIEEAVTAEWRTIVSEWLVQNGCLYMMAWGHECSAWDDSVDLANIEAFNFGEIPDEKFVMTTWHNKESLEHVFWLSHHCAEHPAVDLQQTILIHISTRAEKQRLLGAYRIACRG